jgi:DNA-binding GntR family transcriptional regulator
MFGMSRTPIIEALRRLERDGLVVTWPKWGTSVKSWTWKEIYEAHCIRRALEGEAASLFVQFAKDEAEEKLPELSDAYDEACLHDVDRMCELDLEFHLHVARSTGFEHLYEPVESSKVSTIVIYYGIILGLFAKRADGSKVKAGPRKRVVKALLVLLR